MDWGLFEMKSGDKFLREETVYSSNVSEILPLKYLDTEKFN